LHASGGGRKLRKLAIVDVEEGKCGRCGVVEGGGEGEKVVSGGRGEGEEEGGEGEGAEAGDELAEARAGAHSGKGKHPTPNAKLPTFKVSWLRAQREGGAIWVCRMQRGVDFPKRAPVERWEFSVGSWVFEIAESPKGV